MYQTNRWSVRGERRPINYLWLAFLLVGLSAAAYAATGTSVPVNVSVSIWSSDGAILAGGSGGNLITVAGTWTFDPVVSAAHPGNYSIKLNGVFQGGSPGADPSAANLYIFNNGILYQQTAANTWYSWTGAGPWSASPVADPRPGVIASIAPTTGSFTSGAGSANAVIATEVATMSSGPAFSGTWSLSGADAASFVISSSTGVLSVGGIDLAANSYNVNAVATQAGVSNSPFSWPIVITGSAGGGCLTGSTCPSLPAGHTWTIAFDDEFTSNSLDTSKWTGPCDGCAGVGGDSPYNNTAGLSIGGGILHLHPTSSGGAEIWTTARYGPGYYEVRAQSDPQDWDDIWTIQQNPVDCQPLSAGAEVDLLENIGGGPSANVHWSGYGSCPQSSSNTAPSATDGFHIWGMLWDASSGYTFYRDGTQFWNLGGPVNGGSNPGILILQAFNNACHACASPTGLLVDWARIYTHN